jgi:RecB family endonuclease NucS
MRLVIATCEVVYEGRLRAHLPPATRLLMVKADGSLSIHADERSYKPLNWMNPPCTIKEEPGRWIVENQKGERLVIDLHEVIADIDHALGVDPGLSKDGVEADLQRLLAANPDVLGEGFTLVRREHPTDIGPVDLLCCDAEGRYVIIEVKRRGELESVEQLSRYLECLARDRKWDGVRGVLAAQQIKPQARTLADARGIECRVVDYDALRGLGAAGLTLF